MRDNVTGRMESKSTPYDLSKMVNSFIRSFYLLCPGFLSGLHPPSTVDLSFRVLTVSCLGRKSRLCIVTKLAEYPVYGTLNLDLDDDKVR